VAINFPIVTTFDDRAIKKADTAFTQLGKTFIGLFSVQKVYQFSKASIRAFADSTREAQLLASQLESVNLGFASPYLNQFIDKLALATGKTGGDLTNAFIALSQATGDVTTAQKLLATALDVSMATGKDLQTVSVALQRAFKGETTALARLRIGFTTAELKGKDFDDVLADLQARFSGGAADAADTFASKLARLTEAVEQAKEAFGEGLVSGLQDSQVEIEELQKDIINLGKVMGATAAGAISFADRMIEQLGRIQDSQAARGLMALFEGFTRFVVGPVIFGEVGQSFNSGNAARIGQANRMSEKAASARLRQQNALSRAEEKAARQKLANEKKVTAEKKKQNTESKIIDEINKRFELDRIQIAAALGGQINEVEKLRLELMQAILDEDVKRAIILEGQLIQAEAAAKELAFLLDSLDEMVGDPFADWPGTISRIQELLKQLNIKIPIETLFAEKGLKLDQEKMTVTKLERMDVNANNVYINGQVAGQTAGGAMTGFSPQGWPESQFPVGSPEHALAVGIRAAAMENNASALLAESDALLALLEAENAAREAANAANAEALAALFAQLGLDANGNPITVNVNVGGSVISEGDLTELITNQLYQYQKSGKGLLYSSVVI
jgi:hypothetical protein